MSDPGVQPDVERLRHRLNLLALVIPGQWLSLTAMYWLRFIPAFRPFEFDVPAPPPWLLLVCAGTLMVPAVLPAAYFRTRAFERGRFYRRFGLRVFHFMAPDGGWVNARLRRIHPAYRVVRDRASRRAHLAASRTNEGWHLSWFLLGMVTVAHAVATDQAGWALLTGAFNVAFNLLPVLHQRDKRSRLSSRGSLV